METISSECILQKIRKNGTTKENKNKPLYYFVPVMDLL
jgi:hypothetical protein